MDIQAFIKQFETPRNEGGGRVGFWYPAKAGPGRYFFRPYPFYRDGELTLHAIRQVHFRGPGKYPVEVGSPEAREVEERIAHLKAVGDPDSLKKAEALEPVTQYSMVGALRHEPKSLVIWDQSPAVARASMVAIAQVGGYVSNKYPFADSSSPAELEEFVKKFNVGLAKIAGPEGMDLMVEYVVKPKKQTTVTFMPFAQEGKLTYPWALEDVEDPDIIRRRIAENAAKKGE